VTRLRRAPTTSTFGIAVDRHDLARNQAGELEIGVAQGDR